jgi:hypothetical protein
MIADRPYLAAQLKDLRRMLSELDDWTDNPVRQFPGDSVAIADQLRWLAALLVADEDVPGGQAG